MHFCMHSQSGHRFHDHTSDRLDKGIKMTRKANVQMDIFSLRALSTVRLGVKVVQPAQHQDLIPTPLDISIS